MNKIDKEPVMPLSKIYDLCETNDIKLFFSSKDMDCLAVLHEIVIWYENKKDS